MNYLEISNIAAACGKNPYEEKQKIILLLMCRKYKEIYKTDINMLKELINEYSFHSWRCRIDWRD